MAQLQHSTQRRSYDLYGHSRKVLGWNGLDVLESCDCPSLRQSVDSEPPPVGASPPSNASSSANALPLSQPAAPAQTSIATIASTPASQAPAPVAQALAPAAQAPATASQVPAAVAPASTLQPSPVPSANLQVSASNTAAAPSSKHPSSDTSESAGQPADVVLQLAKSGSTTTDRFTVGSTWAISWQFDCSKAGSDNTFKLAVQGSSYMLPITKSGLNGSDTTYFHQPGTYHRINNAMRMENRCLTMSIDRVPCPRCKQMIKATARFCSTCGEQVQPQQSTLCSQCGTPMEAQEQYCPECGALRDWSCRIADTRGGSRSVLREVQGEARDQRRRSDYVEGRAPGNRRKVPGLRHQNVQNRCRRWILLRSLWQDRGWSTRLHRVIARPSGFS